jgi:cytochrome P450
MPKMINTIKKPFAERPPYFDIALAYGRSILEAKKLPPGDLIHLDKQEREHRNILIERSAIYGPIFKGLIENRLAICVVDNTIGQRLLRKHSSSLCPVSIELKPLFPFGFMRQMEGECHRQYRSLLVRGINGFELTTLTPYFMKIATTALNDYSNMENPDGYSWSTTLSRIATDFLLLLVFGAEPGGRASELLRAAYNKLGPNGVAWYINDRQNSAFASLREVIQTEIANGDLCAKPGLLQRMLDLGSVDETMLGNLIYMVEIGRYDLRGFFRWLSKYAAEQTAWLDRIATEEKQDGLETEAFVLEVLRMDQSERFMRNVIEDFSFEDFFIPKNALIRICMWEAHKNNQIFPDPFQFNPNRHLTRDRLGERFSPFGLDHHHCPFASISIRLAILFVRVLARGYRIRKHGGDRSVRGAYHWEPSPDFTVNLRSL